ncbi:MAG: nitrous oxide reductase family maturation protein NosD [Hyphomicrobiaceae bacterium]|nr:nitrous oxide reductase family maturation protein NosD [Hyphomicrobiaceae bacterium]
MRQPGYGRLNSALLPLAVAVLALRGGAVVAETRIVPAEPGKLTLTLTAAAPGDTLMLEPGRHDGPLVLDRPVTIDGRGHAEVIGNGEGSVITVAGRDITIRGLRISGSGSNHAPIDSGILIARGSERAVAEGNVLTGNLHGVTVHGGTDAIVRNNTIIGRRDRRLNDRGNGIYVWNAPGALIEGNNVRYGRDGIFANTSKRNTFRNNLFRDLRFAVHYMYTHDSEVIGNTSIGNHLGYAVMFSNKIRIIGNLSLRDRTHGIMLNYANSAEIRNNLVRGGTHEKCTFIYNAHKNMITGNRFEHCDIGIHFTAGSERNKLTGNGFIGNRHQVKYVGTRKVEWSDEGRGNYWSDHYAFDLDGDGLADSAFRPNDLMDHVLWSQPAAKLLLGSPAVQLIRWSQHAFPAILPGGVIDSHPRMSPPAIGVPETIAALERAARPDWLEGGGNVAVDPLASH